ncbi:prophage L54a domain protein [Staphylococcus aureus]|nr:prophage L54a domain protein [Staphylococcus aureus]
MNVIAKENIITRIKKKLIDNWIDQSTSKLYDFSPWKNNLFGVINNTLETNETIFSAITKLSNSMASLPLKMLKIIK